MLLQVQLLGIVVYPFLGDRPLSRAIFGIFGLLVLVLALRVVHSTPALTWVAVVLGVPIVVLTVLEAVLVGNDGVALASAILHCVFYGYTAVSLIRYMFNDDRVTLDELLATGATFTVVAWAYAYAFAAVQIIWPGSFIGDSPGDRRTWMELLYLSVTILTSLGLSDMVPVRPHARAAVMLAQISGMLYVALVIARVTALTVMSPGKDRRVDQE